MEFGFDSKQEQRFSSFPQCPHWLWGSLSCLSSGRGGAFQARIFDFCGIFHLLEVFIQPVNNLQYMSILLSVHSLYSEA